MAVVRPSVRSAPMLGQWASEHAVGLVVAAAVLVRLPLLNQKLGLDEAGYLTIGQQWHLGGHPGAAALYGNYWVDRPPLLVTIFGVASRLGGAVPLRLIGCLATALVVLGAAHVARRMAGGSRRAALWAAVAAAALCVDPLIGTAEVNGELLAAPFVVWGMAAALAATEPAARGRRVLLAAAGTGAVTVAAVLVKQNFADAGVFALFLLVLGTARREISWRRAIRLVLGFVAGAGACLAVAAAWTVLHGTSLHGVFEAMYPFRLAADHVMRTQKDTAPTLRMWLLMWSWVITGGGVLMAVMVWSLASRRLRGTSAWALLAMLGFEIVSVVLGGNFWTHYLVQLVVPVSVAAGILAARQGTLRVVVCAMTAVSIAATAVLFTAHLTNAGTRAGEAIARVARPQDTIVTIYGHSDVTHSSGLTSPYPYLWNLPIKTLDPRLRLLDKVLSGPRAPTWFVSCPSIVSWGVDSSSTVRLVHSDYRKVADLDGVRIYLRDGVHRPVPTAEVQNASSSELAWDALRSGPWYDGVRG